MALVKYIAVGTFILTLFVPFRMFNVRAIGYAVDSAPPLVTTDADGHIKRFVVSSVCYNAKTEIPCGLLLRRAVTPQAPALAKPCVNPVSAGSHTEFFSTVLSAGMAKAALASGLALSSGVLQLQVRLNL